MTAVYYRNYHQRIVLQSGISFEREVKAGSDMISGALFFDGNFCNKQDAFGDNDCSFPWGSTISGNLEVTANITLDVGDTLGGDVTVRACVLCFLFSELYNAE